MFSRKNKWAGVDLLDMIPQQARAAQIDPDSGRVLVIVPRCSGPVLSRIMQPLLPERKKWLRVPLDARGGFLWDRIDGRTDIRTLAAAFRAKFPTDAENSDHRVALYLATLRENKFIRFVNEPK